MGTPTAAENQIRPSVVTAEYSALLSAEIIAHFSANDRSNYIVAKNCHACESSDIVHKCIKNNFQLDECTSCGYVFVNPRPPEYQIVDFFKKSEAIGIYSRIVEETKASRKNLIFSPLVDYIESILPRKSSILEIGCGAGLLLEELDNRKKWNCCGLEPSEETVNLCKAKGLNVLHGSLDGICDIGSYDMIVMWAVLDHFVSPDEMLIKTKSMLNESGMLLIGNINIDGFDSKIMGCDNPAFCPPERMNFFGVASIARILRKAGFSDINVVTNGKLDVDIVKNYWSNGGVYNENEFLESVINNDALAQSFQNWLMQNNMAGHMRILAKA